MRMPLNRSLAKTVLISLTFIITACGAAEMKSEDNRSVKVTGEEQAGATGDCFGLGQINQPNQSPYQGGPMYGDKYQKQTHIEDDIIIQPKQPKIVRRPCQNPGQSQFPNRPIPGKGNCTKNCDTWNNGPDNVYVPIEPGVEPSPWPNQIPPQAGACGKKGNFCNFPGQVPPRFPDFDAGGRDYNRQDIDRCMGAFQSAGMKPGGMWQVQARKINSVSVLSSGVVEDFGLDNNIVIINSVNVLGVTDFHLMNHYHKLWF